MAIKEFTRPVLGVTNLLALTKPTAQKNNETLQIVSIPPLSKKTTGELTS